MGPSMSYIKRHRSPDSAIGINGTKKRKFAVIDLTVDSDDEEAPKVPEPKRRGRHGIFDRSSEPVTDAKDAFDLGVVEGPVGPIELSSDSESDDDDDSSSDNEEDDDDDGGDDEPPIIHRPSIPRPTFLSSNANKPPVLGVAVKIPSIPSRDPSVRSSAAFSTGASNGLAARLSTAPSNRVAVDFSDQPSTNAGIARASSPISSRSNKPLKMAIDFAELHRLAQKDKEVMPADTAISADKETEVAAQKAATINDSRGPFVEDSEDEADAQEAIELTSKANANIKDRISGTTNGLTSSSSRKRIFEPPKVNEQHQAVHLKKTAFLKPKQVQKEVPRPTLLQQLLPPLTNKEQPVTPVRPGQPRSLKSIVEAQTQAPKQTPQEDSGPAKKDEREIERREIEAHKQANTELLAPAPIAITTTVTPSNPWIQEQKTRKSDLDKGRYRKPEQEHGAVKESIAKPIVAVTNDISAKQTSSESTTIVPCAAAPATSIEFKSVSVPKVLKTAARRRRQPPPVMKQNQTTFRAFVHPKASINEMQSRIQSVQMPLEVGMRTESDFSSAVVSSPLISNAAIGRPRPVTGGKHPTNPAWWRHEKQQTERYIREYGEELLEEQELQEFRDRNKTPEEYQHLPEPEPPVPRSPSPINRETDRLYFIYQIWRRVWYGEEDEDQRPWTLLPRVYICPEKATKAATKVIHQKKDGYRILHGNVLEFSFKQDKDNLPSWYFESITPVTDENGESVLLKTHARVEVRRELAPPEMKRFPRSKKGWLPRTTYVIKIQTTKIDRAAIDAPVQPEVNTMDGIGVKENMMNGTASDAESNDDDDNEDEFERQMQEAFMNARSSSKSTDEPSKDRPEGELERAGSDIKSQTDISVADAQLGDGDLPTPADTQPGDVLSRPTPDNSSNEIRTIIEQGIQPELFTSLEIANHRAAMYILDTLFPGSKKGRLRLSQQKEYNDYRTEMQGQLEQLKDAGGLFDCTFDGDDGIEKRVSVEKLPVTGPRNI